MPKSDNSEKDTAMESAVDTDVLTALEKGPLGRESGKLKKARLSKIERMRKGEIERPIIFIGTGTCGLGAGAGKTLNAVRNYLKEKHINADIIEVGCIGLCASEPILDFQMPGMARISFEHITEDKVKGLLDDLFSKKVPSHSVMGQHGNGISMKWDGVPELKEHPFFKRQTRWVLANCGIIDPLDIDAYIAMGGYQALANATWKIPPKDLCDIVEKSGLKGRGGGGFPTGRKWKIALSQGSDQKYMICNADEGDPGAFMDRAVIEGDPHRIVEGLALASYAIGASKAYVYIRAEYPLAIVRLKEAISQAKKYGLLGENILDSGFNLEIVIKQGAGAFVCGEETALINSIEGRRGMPRPRPPFPAEKGVFDKPSIINNVETLANVPLIVLNGADWFSSVGTKTSKGTKVFALSGKVARTGLVEIAMGTTLKEIVMEIGGGIPNGRKFKAVQIGGPSGGCIPSQHLGIEVDYETLKTVGAIMGSGGLVVMDEDTCMVDVAKFFMDFIQRESCGKCIPCREGTRRMLEILQSITRSRKSEKGFQTLERFKGIIQMQKLADVIRDTSLCGLGQTAPNPVLSTLRWFRDEYEAHIFNRKCPAGACTELLTYSIDAEKCVGCTLCAKKCPSNAIMGAVKSPHYIVEDKCISCGTCVEVCRFGAVKVE